MFNNLTSSANNLQQDPNVRLVGSIAASASLGYLLCHVFTVVSPVHAAIFCGTATLINSLVKEKLKDKNLFKDPENKLIEDFAKKNVCVLLACAVVHLAGEHLHFGEGMLIWLSVALVKASIKELYAYGVSKYRA